MKPTPRLGVCAILESHGATQRHPAYPSCVRKTEQRAEVSWGSCVVERELVPAERGVEARMEAEKEQRQAPWFSVVRAGAQGTVTYSPTPQPSSPWQSHLPRTPELDLVLRSEASLRGSLSWGCPDWSPAVQNLGQHPEHLGRELLSSNQLDLRGAPPLGSQGISLEEEHLVRHRRG